ncbi:voltage-dependent T-type calcium channel subunit alpha-1G-like [Sphaeramia orbicularis]|uniref:voltage-dependent T-type calcium channel subunit alpha-1G-like n=1 Tax=Sphaeramia orbicularis TaxID=375764 RepID=UPI00117E8BC2|nr:voltage-dependent T-type calcium channel subunit alpha-1G-like [Sphaeramia orbicularis]
MCTSHYLDLFITIVIGLNVITMSMEHYQQPKELDEALKICNYIFTLIFVLESVFKLVAFGFRRFFKDKWNQLDLAIVLLSIMGITLEEIEVNASLPINPTIIRIMRVLRIARVLKLLKMAVGMRALLDTVMQALPQVGNLGLLFMLLFFIFAALGVELFGDLSKSTDTYIQAVGEKMTGSISCVQQTNTGRQMKGRLDRPICTGPSAPARLHRPICTGPSAPAHLFSSGICASASSMALWEISPTTALYCPLVEDWS